MSTTTPLDHLLYLYRLHLHLLPCLLLHHPSSRRNGYPILFFFLLLELVSIFLRDRPFSCFPLAFLPPLFVVCLQPCTHQKLFLAKYPLLPSPLTPLLLYSFGEKKEDGEVTIRGREKQCKAKTSRPREIPGIYFFLFSTRLGMLPFCEVQSPSYTIEDIGLRSTLLVLKVGVMRVTHRRRQAGEMGVKKKSVRKVNEKC